MLPVDLQFHIGDVCLEHPFLLGPMAHYTNRPTRIISRRLGAALVCTEMIAAQHFVRCGPKYRIVADFGPEEHPIAAQVAPAAPEYAAEATRLLDARGFDIIDINMCCPARKIVKRGRGAALLNDPDRAVAVTEAVLANTSRPVTVKMRIGWSEETGPQAINLAQRLESLGVAAFCLHPRFAKQLYKGRANWLWIGELAQTCRVPVIGSGDLMTALDAVNMLRETRCAAVALARGALGNPWIFAQAVACLRNGTPLRPPSEEELRGVVREHCRLSSDIMGWPNGYHVMRRTMPRYLRAMPAKRRMLRELGATRTREDWDAWQREWGFD